MTNLPYKDYVSVLEDIRDFINNSYSGVSGSPIEDPLSDAGKSRGSGTGIASIEDEEETQNMPKIVIYPLNMPRERIAGGKSEYRERYRYQLAIKYTCHKNHTWTYDSTAHKGARQCIRYLQYLGDQIKKYSGSFTDMNELVLGSVSNPVKNADNLTYSAYMELKIDSYGKIGE